MMQLKYRCLVFVLIFFVQQSGFAWGNNGHILVAKIAYEQMHPQTRAAVDRLNQVTANNYPRTKGFVRSSIWADWIKSDGVDAFDSWHFINLTYSADGTKAKIPYERHNVVWAIYQSRKVLQSKRANDFEKAMFLRMLVHLVGDLHQPLHCINRVSKSLPRGDEGGNLFVIRAPKNMSLHRYWDGGAGLFRKYSGKQGINRLATEIQMQYPRKSFQKQLAKPKVKSWAWESYNLAKHNAYAIQEYSSVTPEYQNSSQEIVKQQIALAGYRLADLLDQSFS